MSCGLGLFRKRPSGFLGLFGAGRFVKARSSAVLLLLHCLFCSQTPRTAEKPPLGGKRAAPLSTVSYTDFLFFIEVTLLPRLRAARLTDDWSGVVCLPVGELLFAGIFLKSNILVGCSTGKRVISAHEIS